MRKKRTKPPSCETVDKPSLNNLHESPLFQQVMSANMSKEKLLPYIKLVSSPNVRYAGANFIPVSWTQTQYLSGQANRNDHSKSIEN